MADHDDSRASEAKSKRRDRTTQRLSRELGSNHQEDLGSFFGPPATSRRERGTSRTTGQSSSRGCISQSFLSGPISTSKSALHNHLQAESPKDNPTRQLDATPNNSGSSSSRVRDVNSKEPEPDLTPVTSRLSSSIGTSPSLLRRGPIASHPGILSLAHLPPRRPVGQSRQNTKETESASTGGPKGYQRTASTPPPPNAYLAFRQGTSPSKATHPSNPVSNILKLQPGSETSRPRKFPNPLPAFSSEAGNLKKASSSANKWSFGEQETSKPSSTMAAPRNRAPRGNRGLADNDTEESRLWAEIQSSARDGKALETEINVELEEYNGMVGDFKKREREGNPPTYQELDTLDKLARKIQTQSSKQKILNDGLVEKLTVLQGLQAANEVHTAEPLRRGGSSRDGAKTFDNDTQSNSPAPSSSVDREKSNLKRVSRESRGSLPPKDTAIKQETASNQSASSNTGTSTNSKGKTEFMIGDEVAWRPKKETHQDWIQCNVIKVIGEGKSRRYDVQDPEPDEKTLVGAIHRTSASSMVAIPSAGSVLPDYAPKTTVLARYPDTTTFYKAEVIRMTATGVILAFEGEDDPNDSKEVERRLVLDYPRL